MTGGAADFCCDTGGSGEDGDVDVQMTKDLRWDKPILKVCFLNDIKVGLRQEIMTLARDWTNYANIKLEVTVKKSEADIRITTHCDSFSSQVGTNANTCDKGAATMKLKDHHIKVIPRKVRHEFGHALGLFHEHQLTDTDELLIPYDESLVYKYYAENTNWTTAKVRHNVLSRRKKDGIHALKSSMDQFSVMLYPIKVKCLDSPGLAQHFCVSESATLSVEDRIHIMRMYPGQKPDGFDHTSQNFNCRRCGQWRVKPLPIIINRATNRLEKAGAEIAEANNEANNANPRFQYSRDGLCLACAWTSDLKPIEFKCRRCSHKQPIHFQLSSEDTWACKGCDEYTRWRPVF